MLVNIQNNKMILDLSVVKKQRQKNFLMSLIKNNDYNEAFRYVSSFNGLKQNSIYRPTLRHYTDSLERKGSGSVLKMLQKMVNPDANHKPISKFNDYFGVEIECFIPLFQCDNCDGDGCGSCDSGTLSDYDSKNELKQMIIDKKIKYCSVKGDASIRNADDTFPVELTILTRFSDTSNLKKLTDLLNRLDARVNKSCGLHIHLDARHLDGHEVVQIGKKFARAMPVLTAMVPESRRDNQYCINRVSKLTGSRYFAVNLTAFKKYNTIEVRLHSSTTDFKKIMNWAILLNAIQNSNIKTVCRDVNELTDFIKIDENLMEYIAQRTELFSKKENKIVSSDALDQDFEQSA